LGESFAGLRSESCGRLPRIGLSYPNQSYFSKGNEAGLNFVFDTPIDRRFWVKLRAAEDNYQDESRIRVTVAGVEPIDHDAESVRLLNEIRQMM
jgi:hypothetical protein